MNSFLINMDRLFEKFIINLMRKELRGAKEIKIEEQESDFIDDERKLEARLDILVHFDNKPILILDTKYIEYRENIEGKHIAQMNLYADLKKINNCGLIYVGNHHISTKNIKKINLQLFITCIDLAAKSNDEFANKCQKVISSITDIIFIVK